MRLKFLLGILLLAIATPVLAHAPKVGMNGGPQTNAGGLHVEAVAKGSTLQVYLRDHADKSVSSAGYKATAVLVVNGKPVRILLLPAEQNTLVGTAESELPHDLKGAIQITGPQGTVQARFD